MIAIIIIVSIVIAFGLGLFTGTKLIGQSYDGVITMAEMDGKLICSLELAGDPELLINQDEARFKIIAPSYEKLLSQK